MQAMRQLSSSLLGRLHRRPGSPRAVVEAATSNTGEAVVATIEGVGTHEVFHLMAGATRHAATSHMTAVVEEAAVVAPVATHRGVVATARPREVHRRGPIRPQQGLGTHHQSTRGLAMAVPCRHVKAAVLVVVGAGTGQVLPADVQVTEAAAEDTDEAIQGGSVDSCRSGGSGAIADVIARLTATGGAPLLLCFLLVPLLRILLGGMVSWRVALLLLMQ